MSGFCIGFQDMLQPSNSKLCLSLKIKWLPYLICKNSPAVWFFFAIVNIFSLRSAHPHKQDWPGAEHRRGEQEVFHLSMMVFWSVDWNVLLISVSNVSPPRRTLCLNCRRSRLCSTLRRRDPRGRRSTRPPGALPRSAWQWKYSDHNAEDINDQQNILLRSWMRMWLCTKRE